MNTSRHPSPVSRRTLALGMIMLLLAAVRPSSAGMGDAAGGRLTIIRTSGLERLGIAGTVERIRLSPDLHLAALLTRDGQAKRLYVVDLATLQAERIDPRRDVQGYPQWEHSPLARLYHVVDDDPQWRPSESAAEQMLVFISNGIEDQNDVFMYSPLTKAVTRLTATPLNESLPRWSPDGSTLTYAVRDVDTDILGFTNVGARVKQAQGIRLQAEAMPGLSTVFATEVFQRPGRVFRTPMLIHDLGWMGGELIVLGGSAASGSDARLFRVDQGGRARPVAVVNGATALQVMPGDEAVCVLQRAGRPEAGTWFGECVTLPVTGGFRTATPAQTLLNNGRVMPVMPALVGRTTIAVAGMVDGGLSVSLQSRVKDARTTVIRAAAPEDGAWTGIHAWDLAPRPQGDAGEVNLVAVASGPGEDVLILGSLEMDEEYDDDIVRKSVSLYLGAAGQFSRYTGDYAPGVFNPGVTVFAEGRMNRGVFRRVVAGVNLAYTPLSASPKDREGFSSHLWQVSVHARYEWPAWLEVSPYLGLHLGKTLFNNRRNISGDIINPLGFGIDAGVVFDINAWMRISAFGSYTLLSDDIDRMREVRKSDSFAAFGAGFHYLLPL